MRRTCREASSGGAGMTNGLLEGGKAYWGAPNEPCIRYSVVCLTIA